MAKSDEFIINLGIRADEYISECLSHTKEVVSGSGKVIEVRDRHIPTIDYFLNIWLPLLKLDKITRETYYVWLKSDNELKSDTIKKIDDTFKALAVDIVANEGKGIFYAKNRLGMHDKQHIETKTVTGFDFDN
ncbi:hypothetical protein UFOVP514_48 [uncultured Caudovirales phage]|jgi:hypothetical protein|uniref:Uncharacterized protein n=1 Tax=uncultured Caudovirales phage TaxID=2100421 RepID=A0A6J5MS16_9CAUD|nr:hypothetical protein UFOVP514_48 [uncultured Caudovirales phage]